MVDIDELNKATLLYNLANRYNNPELMEIYLGRTYPAGSEPLQGSTSLRYAWV